MSDEEERGQRDGKHVPELQSGRHLADVADVGRVGEIAIIDTHRATGGGLGVERGLGDGDG